MAKTGRRTNYWQCTHL